MKHRLTISSLLLISYLAPIPIAWANEGDISQLNNTSTAQTTTDTSNGISDQNRDNPSISPKGQTRVLELFSLALGLLLLICLAYLYRYRRRLHQFTHTRDWHSTILDKMVDGVITIDEQGIIHSINPAGERIFGYRAAEIIGKKINILMPSPYREEHDSYIANYIHSNHAHIIGFGREVKGMRKNADIFPMDLAVSEIRFKGQRMFSGIVRDISERIEAEKTQQDSTSRLQAVLDNVLDGIITINAKGIVQSFNPAAEKIFGYRSDEVLGKNISMLMPSPYQQEHDTYLETYQKTGKAHIIGIGREVEGLRKDGTVFPLELAVSQMNIDGEAVFNGIVRDITERKQMEKMKNEFISTVSHELRTPLTSIRGSLSLVMAETVGKLPEQVKEMLTITTNNTERLLLLINDILDIQKIESGMMAFRFHSLDLNSFLQQAIQANQSYAEQYNVRFVLKPGQANTKIYADIDRLMQVMNNLMSNAAKFSPRGDTVELSTSRRNGTIRVSVSDHGPGIANEFRSKIFEKFTQYDSTDTRRKGGTGLGLSISRLIIEKHGGQIDYVSQPKVGSTFFFELPELISELGTNALPLELSGEHSPSILIVEDDLDVAAILQRMLAEAGFNSDIAYTASEARLLLRQKTGIYKAMTLDIILPDEGGIELLNSIRQNEETRDLPVIVVSIKADETQRQLNGGAVGILDWINKPIDEQRLKHAIRHALGPKAGPRVLHVEDEQDVHQVVSRMLQNEVDMVWTSTVSASREILEQEEFDLVLLDISLPDGSGLDLLETIERRVKPPNIIIFSAQNVEPEIAQQVNSVLVKSHTSNDELLKTITSTINGL